jgi:hypothetical protein
MGMSDYLGWIHGKADRSSGSLVPVVFGTSGALYSEDQLDFGAAVSGAPAEIAALFPSIANGAIRVGLHIVITQAYTIGSGCTGGDIWIVTSATQANTATPTFVTGRRFTLAQLAVLGNHFFIPLPPMGKTSDPTLLEFVAAYFSTLGGYAPAAGGCEMWFGPGADGCI